MRRLLAANYEYPSHLREQAAELPSAPGVYLFKSSASRLPLYIGKSVNLRARVLSHLRNREEAHWLRQSDTLEFIRTAGDLGAQLLEASLIKTCHPLHNRQLRRTRRLHSLRWQEGKIDIVHSGEIDFACAEHIHGLFASRTAAMNALRDCADACRLCYGLLGLEQVKSSRGCFRASLQRCGGACCGRESVEAHDERLRQALGRIRVMAWPHPAAIAIKERGADMTQWHVVHKWHYLGSAPSLTQARRLNRVSPGFDGDSYRILVEPILSQRYPSVVLSQ